MKILIVPGHGGPDRGAVSKCGRIEEAAYVLRVGLQLVTAVRHVGIRGVQVDISRIEDDSAWPVRRRVALANELGADLVMCLHLDSAQTDGPSGARAYHWPGNHATKQIADSASRSALNSTGRFAIPTDPEGYPQAHALLAAYPMPVVLCEMGFLSSPRDVDWMMRRNAIEDMAAGLIPSIYVARAVVDAQPASGQAYLPFDS